MKTIKLLFILLICLTFPVHKAVAQGYFQFGYGAGYGNAGELNKLIYLHNKLYSPNKEMGGIKTFKGFHLAAGAMEEIGIEFKWQNRNAKTTSEIQVDGLDVKQDLKLRANTFDINFFLGEDDVHFGLGVYFGTMKAFGRTYELNASKTEYEQLFALDDQGNSEGLASSSVGFNFIIDYRFSKAFGTRLTYQSQLGSTRTDNLDNFLLGDENSFGAIPPELTWNNIGVELYIRFGGY